ncbi:MAG: zinc ABC transporter substrate-binding protein [Thermoguttaceae bacterium]|nr:zinc ABC transporter substrate-binding protein [Thermoguttaceae bacterium]MDW8038463.1 zinc ABC transporter substrate-binding protein [Thermoguttaceae bacterium]
MRKGLIAPFFPTRRSFHGANEPGKPMMLWLSVILLLAGCSFSSPNGSGGEVLRVGVSIEPVAFLVDQLAGPHVQVQVLIPAGADAHTFQLSPRQMADLAQSDVFIRVGLALEDRILQQIRQHRSDFPVIDLAQGIARRSFRAEEGYQHCGLAPPEGGHPSESAEHPHHSAKHRGESVPDEHSHTHSEACCHDDAVGESAGWDPHIWLSPPLLKEQACRIAQTLCQLDPAHAHQYRQNLARLEADLDALDTWIRQQLAPYRGRAFFVFHPSFGYFADCYGLRQLAIQVEGKSPSPPELRRLIQQAQAEQASIILVQPQFDRRAAQVVAQAIGARLVEINDLDRNVLDTLKKLTKTLLEAFGTAKSTQPRSA